MTAKILELQMKKRFGTVLKKARSIRNKHILPSMRFDERNKGGQSALARSTKYLQCTSQGKESLLVESQRRVYISEQGALA